MDYELMMNENVKIGQKAPEFLSETTFGNKSLQDYKGRWLVFFSLPGAFTSVCTTEMISFSRTYNYFKKNNTELLGLSTDSISSILAWMYDIYKKTGIKTPFPIISDRNGQIARKYGMFANDISSTQPVRNVYIIDNKQIIRTIMIYPLKIGRFIPEIIRTIQSLQISDYSQCSTPANWIPNQPLIKSSPKTFNELEKKETEIINYKNGISWYLTFKESQKLDNKNNKKIPSQKE